MKAWQVGDRVRFRLDHPWSGATGTILKPCTEDGLDWIVELDGLEDRRAGARSSQLRHIPKTEKGSK